jgi:hypothetical protein
MSHITREAYEKLVAEDLAWLEKQPRTLERDHVMLIVQNSVDQLYGPKPPTPFYERSLDSFADEIITQVAQSNDGLYYAWLARPPGSYITADFSACRTTAEQAIAHCAAKIRQDHLGIGRYAPHRCLSDGYTLRFVLMKYWAELEQAVANRDQDDQENVVRA